MTYRNSEEMNIDFNGCFYADKHKPIHALKRWGQCHQVFTYSSSLI